jgi:hypothetical protein
VGAATLDVLAKNYRSMNRNALSWKTLEKLSEG